MFKDKNILTIFTLLLQSLVIVVFNQIIYVSNEIIYLKKMLPFMNLLILIITIFVLSSVKEAGENIKKSTELNFLKGYIKQIESLVDTLHTQKHEHGRHIQAIQSMIYLDEVDEAKEYINGINEEYYHPQDIIYTGNPALTSLVSSKQKVAELKNIDFEVAIKCDVNMIPLAPWDLCTVVNNLLDNAFEIVLMKETDRQVALEIKRLDDEYIIYVSNNGPKISNKEKNKIFRPGYTTKDSKGRGYGLYIINRIVNNCGGRISLFSNDKTVFKIHIPKKNEVEYGKEDIKKIS